VLMTDPCVLCRSCPAAVVSSVEARALAKGGAAVTAGQRVSWLTRRSRARTTYWAFAFVSCVGCAINQQLNALALLVANSSRKFCCVLTAYWHEIPRLPALMRKGPRDRCTRPGGVAKPKREVRHGEVY
jgi:hypothetical protein